MAAATKRARNFIFFFGCQLLPFYILFVLKTDSIIQTESKGDGFCASFEGSYYCSIMLRLFLQNYRSYDDGGVDDVLVALLCSKR